MIDPQKESPAVGQGFDNSRGGECLETMCRQILEKSSGGRVRLANPLLWQWTNEAMPLRLMAGDNEFRLCNPIHPFQIANAARRAAESGMLYPIYLIGDGKPSLRSYSVQDAEAWLRGEAGA
jgi:hypothetical protein